MKVFKDRIESAQILAQRLADYRGKNPLVLGIPRGAVPMAKVIADELQGELDVVLVRKLGAPFNPELAIGSVSENGDVYLGDYAREFGLERAYIDQEVERQMGVIRRRRAMYAPQRSPADPTGRLVIVVDNGVATGSTMIAALRATRARRPDKLIAAMAVAPPDTVARIRAEADDVVCLETPEFFYAVSQFFEDFSEVRDEDVTAILKKQASMNPAR